MNKTNILQTVKGYQKNVNELELHETIFFIHRG